jgi:hypothetical protein
MCLFSVHALLCLGRGLATGWSLVQGVLPIVNGSGDWKEPRAHKDCRAIKKYDLWFCLIDAVSNSACIASYSTVIGDYWIGNDWRKRSWPKLRYCVRICLQGLRKTTKATIRVAGFPAENRIRRLPSTSQKRCRFSQLSRYVLILFFSIPQLLPTALYFFVFRLTQFTVSCLEYEGVNNVNKNILKPLKRQLQIFLQRTLLAPKLHVLDPFFEYPIHVLCNFRPYSKILSHLWKTISQINLRSTKNTFVRIVSNNLTSHDFRCIIYDRINARIPLNISSFLIIK